MINTFQAYSVEIINLNVEIVKDANYGNPSKPKTPIRIPSIGIEDHTLYIYNGYDNATIEIVDEDDFVVFATTIEEGTEQISLPTYLSGTYEIRIVREGITFVGEITL